MRAFDRHSAWLLELAAERQFPIGKLSAPDLPEQINRAGHGLVRAQIISTLAALAADGLIFLRGPDGPVARPDESQLAAAVDEDASVRRSQRRSYFGLTSRGGVAWESIAEPAWPRYVDASWGTDPNEAIVTGADLACLRPWVAANIRAISGFGAWEVVRPWPATYWKTLPLGRRLRCEHDPEDEPMLGATVEAWYRRVQL
ncbi:MAG: hypothetical protein AAF721_03020 [Myxococcota bacterium]